MLGSSTLVLTVLCTLVGKCTRHNTPIAFILDADWIFQSPIRKGRVAFTVKLYLKLHLPILDDCVHSSTEGQDLPEELGKVEFLCPNH